MSFSIASVFVIGVLSAVDNPKTDLDRFQGTWVMTDREVNGQKTNQEMIRKGEYHVMFEGNNVFVNQEGRIIEFGTMKLDPTEKPKHYDRMHPDRTASRGIYELDGETLNICLGSPGADRPAEFSTKPGAKRSLIVYRRFKPYLPTSSHGGDRSPQVILNEIDDLKMAPFDLKRRKDEAYIREYDARNKQRYERRALLIRELYKAAPDHERILVLLLERWGRRSPISPEANELNKEIDEVVAHSANQRLKVEGTFFKAWNDLPNNRSAGRPNLTMIDEFLKIAPGDTRGASLLYSAAKMTRDGKAKAALEDRILRDFPGPQSVLESIKSDRHQRESIGKPFKLEFTDAVNGRTVSTSKLNGKILVIDFWATWCGPCVAEVPHLKELYAKYNDQGVEFIGVSLDLPEERGGLESLRKFIKENEVPWPQYYQGNGWESAFSRTWDIKAIPAVFVVDSAGMLVSIDARGELDQLIPHLLEGRSGDSGRSDDSSKSQR
jgi:uncharacterized protein (TIGR03067 family)